MYRLWILFIVVFAASTVFAVEETIKIDEVVVSATKIEESVEETTSSVLVIPEEKIKASENEFAVEILKNIPEINVAQTGGPGKQATIILRGGSSHQTMVLIDGVQVKSTTLGSFDFGGISSEDIERIEIIKGPQSTIYGSEAMAGVINIITKKGKGSTKVAGSYEIGSYNTSNISSSVSGATETVDYRVTGNTYNTDGISSAKDGTEKDGYKNTAFSAKLGVNPSDVFKMEFTGRYSEDRNELDDRGEDALNYVQTGKHSLISGKGTLYLFDIWEQVLTVSQVRDSLVYDDPDTSWNNSDIITSMQTVDWQNNLYLTDNYMLAVGGEYRREDGENKGVFDDSIENKAFYFNNKLTFLDSALVFNAGLRYDDHDTFGNETTYKVGGVYNIRPAGLTLKGSYGTGFSAPTLNQLFYIDGWGSSGNLDLDPEKSTAWELGFEQVIVDDMVSFSATYFSQDYEDLIEWVETPPGSWQYSPQNISGAEVRGVETGVTVNIMDGLALATYYSYMDTENKETGDRLQRRPEDKVNATLDFKRGPLALLTSYTYVGDVYELRTDEDLPSYSLVDISGSYKLNENIQFFARIDNVFDEDYEVAEGYGTPGSSVFAGIRMSNR